MAFPCRRQSDVMNHRGKPLVVVAGPGTGKTKTLIERTKSILRDNINVNVVFLTFTRNSQIDIKNRLSESFGTLSDSELPHVSTLHGFAKNLVHKHSDLVDRRHNFHVLLKEQGEVDLIMEEVLNDLGLDVSLEEVEKMLMTYRNTQELVLPSEIKKSVADMIIISFDQYCDFYNSVDMENLVPLAQIIVNRHPELFEPMYFHVDEYQDLNIADQTLIKSFAQDDKHNVVVVGDDAQSIYSFRNANYNGIREIYNSDDWDSIVFNESFRLPESIIITTQELLKKNSSATYLGASLHTPNSKVEKCTLLECTSSSVEERGVVALVLSLMEDDPNLNYNDIIVLCPINRVVEKFNEAFRKFDVPTKTNIKIKCPEECWELYLIIRMLKKEPLALRQWLDKLKISSTMIKRWRKTAIELGVDLYYYTKHLDDATLNSLFLCIESYKEDTLESFIEFLDTVPGFTANTDLNDTLRSLFEDERFSLNKISDFLFGKYIIFENDKQLSEDDAILITSMRLSKGLEAKVVIVVRLNEYMNPLEGRDPEEELRLLYVACTRAKSNLYLTFHESFDDKKKIRLRLEAASPFIRRISNLLEIILVNKKTVDDCLVK